MRYVDHVFEQGVEFFKLACAQNLEGIVGKGERGTYQMMGATSWVKVKARGARRAVLRSCWRD